MVTAAPPTCFNHRRRPRVATCSTCEHPLCADCVVHTGVGVKCGDCTGVKGGKPAKAGAGAAAAGAGAGGSSSSGRRAPWAVPLAAAGVAVLAVAAYGLANRGSGGPEAVETFQGTAAPFTERSAEFTGPGGHRIGGTLTLPGAGPWSNVPSVLIIPGLGALDRNGVVAASPPDAARDALVSSLTGIGVSSGDPLFKDLSESLAGQGIASFRYEKRGTTPSPLKEGQKLSFDDEVGDARAAFDLLSSRQEVGSAPLVLLGHDTGGMIAMRLSAGTPRVKGVVAISTTPRKVGEVLADDLTRARGAAVGDALRAAMATLAATGKAPPADSLPEIVRPVFAPGHDAYLASVFALDGTAEVANAPVPVLLVRGGADPTISAADTARMTGSFRIGGQVMVGSSQADHNLTLAGGGHEHSNTATAVTVQRDNDTRTALTAWVKGQLGA